MRNEEASRAGVLELDETVVFRYGISDDEVAAEVSEQLILPGHPVEVLNLKIVPAAKRRKVRPTPKEGEEVSVLFEDRIGSE